MASVDDLERVEVTSRAAWRVWLAEHHTTSPGVWLVTYKKHCGDRHLPWGLIVREALCFGWIDSRNRRIDDDRTSALVTPRRAGSGWSAVNKRLVAELESDALFADAGLATIEAAKADGSWVFLDDIEALVEPDDLRAALDDRLECRAGWDASPPSIRKAELLGLKTAKRPATRQKRLQALLARTQALG